MKKETKTTLIIIAIFVISILADNYDKIFGY